jgi:hypothetical protein
VSPSGTIFGQASVSNCPDRPQARTTVSIMRDLSQKGIQG